jgi:hypothetical protein
VIPEPLAGLLWHLAAVADNRPIEVVAARSPIARSLYANSPMHTFLVHEITLDDKLVLVNLSNFSRLKLSPDGELIALDDAYEYRVLPVIVPIRDLTRIHNSFLIEQANNFNNLNLNINETAMTGFYSIEEFLHFSYFDSDLLNFLERVLNLEFTLNHALHDTALYSKASISTGEIFQEVKSSLAFHNRFIKREILNSLLYQAANRVKK